MAQAVTWTFSTPPPVMTAYYPSGVPQPADPLFFIAFDQRVDPADVLETIQVMAGSRSYSLRLAEPGEVEADKTVSRLAENAQEGRWLAFRAAQPLPLDTGIIVTVGPGSPSAEGPLLTGRGAVLQFPHLCPAAGGGSWLFAWSGDICQPADTLLYIRFNNPARSGCFPGGHAHHSA